MTAPYFFIINPSAGSGAGRRVWPLLTQRLHELHIQYEFEMTQGPLTATSFTRQALRQGARTIVAVGGDGTVNEVVNGFFLHEQPVAEDATLGVIPAGSSSDLALALGIPAGAAAADVVANGRVLETDLGRADFQGAAELTIRYFLNNADVGIGARVAAGSARFKRIGGKAAFALSSLAAVLEPQPWRGRVILDGDTADEVEATTVVVALGPYTGGGMRVAPGARMDDGLFDVVTIGALAPRDLVLNLPRLYAGTHVSHPDVRVQRAQLVRVEPEGKPSIELDGEVAGSGPVEFRIFPRGIRVLVPRP